MMKKGLKKIVANHLFFLHLEEMMLLMLKVIQLWDNIILRMVKNI